MPLPSRRPLKDSQGVCFATLIVALALAGCGSSSSATRTSHGGTLLSQTLGSIGYQPSMKGYFEFGDIAAQRTLTGAPATFAALQRSGPQPAGKWRGVFGIGES